MTKEQKVIEFKQELNEIYSGTWHKDAFNRMYTSEPEINRLRVARQEAILVSMEQLECKPI
jgi:hypothetical protein